MTRAATWENIGVRITDANNIEEALHIANLDYTVEKKPIYIENNIMIPGYSQTVANYSDGSSRLVPHGIVSNKYEVCNNINAFDVANYVDGINFVKAGETNTGMVYVIGKLPSINVMGDEITPYLILQNGHNGRYNIKAAICPLRIVCQNQFNWSFGHMPNSINIQHSMSMYGKLEQANRIVASVNEYMKQFNAEAEKLANTHVTYNQAMKIFDEFFMKARIYEELTNRQQNTVNKEIAAIKTAYEADDNQNFKGTLWGMTNAFTDYFTHKEVKNTATAADNKFMTVTFDPNILNNFINFAKERI